MQKFEILLDKILIREDNFALHDVVDFAENSYALEEKIEHFDIPVIAKSSITCTIKAIPKKWNFIILSKHKNWFFTRNYLNSAAMVDWNWNEAIREKTLHELLRLLTGFEVIFLIRVRRGDDVTLLLQS